MVVHMPRPPMSPVAPVCLRPNDTACLLCHAHVSCLCCDRIQSLFNSLGSEAKGKVIGLGGDGRYFNKEAAQIIMKLAAGAGIKKARLLASHPPCSAALALAAHIESAAPFSYYSSCGNERHCVNGSKLFLQRWHSMQEALY